MKRKTEFWLAHITAARLEAVPASEYAKRHGLAVKSLYYWRRKLEVTKPVQQTGINPRSPVPGNKFMALQVTAARQAHCTLSLPSGLRLEMSVLPEPEWLAVLIQSVQR